MHITLLQRLRLDEKSGLNYEYMGYSDYEFGATLTARHKLAELYVLGKLVGFNCSATPCVEDEVEVTGVCEAGKEEEVKKYLTNFRNKGVFATSTTVGWLSVDGFFLIVRGVEHIADVEEFFKPFIDGYKESLAGGNEK